MVEVDKSNSIKLLLGILLNSMLSVISYNNFDLYSMFGIATKTQKEERMHVSTIKKQITYNMILLFGYIGYVRGIYIRCKL